MIKVVEKDGKYCAGDSGKCFDDRESAQAECDSMNEKAAKAFLGVNQQEAAYVTLSATPGQACANCRWFKTYGSEWGMHPTCHLIDPYPEAIEPTGHCNRWESGEIPAAQRDPLPVVIVEAELPDTAEGEAELGGKQQPNLLEQFKAMLNGWRTKLAGEDGTGVGIKVAGNHWLITFSNNFADREGEIFTAKAIDDYVARVDMGVVDAPGLWVWHIGAKTQIGQAEWVGRQGHFLLAAGQFMDTPEAQQAKEFYRKHAKDTGVSHGFTYQADRFDGVCYHAFNTFEISLMPRGKEANRFTSVEEVKEMKLTPEKRQYLEQVFGKENAERILSDYDERGKALEAVEVQYKDFVSTDESAVSPAPEAIKQVEQDVKQLILDMISDSAEMATLIEAGAAARTKDASRITALEQQLSQSDARIKALETVIADRPRQASQSADTEIKQDDVVAEVRKQFQRRHPVTGTLIDDTEDIPTGQ